MIRVFGYILAALLLIGGAQAYYVNLVAPDQISVGETLRVEGSGTLEPGFSTDLIFYQLLSTKKEINRAQIVVQPGGIFSASFPTDGLVGGDYLLELVDPYPGGNEAFGGSSEPMEPVNLVDRSDEITISSPRVQPFNGVLYLKGTLSMTGNNGTEIRVTKGSEVVFGPTFIATQDGGFMDTVPITEGGAYQVSFSDYRGYIGMAQFAVTEATTTATPTSRPAITVSAQASRTEPAYFKVDSSAGTLRIRTSSGIDWILEYVDENGDQYTLNQKGTVGGESVAIETRGGPVYVKVYPATYTDQGTVTLTAENADALAVCTNCAAYFTGTPTPTPTATQKTPLPAAIALFSLIFLALKRR